jgi:hypothetical protein
MRLQEREELEALSMSGWSVAGLNSSLHSHHESPAIFARNGLSNGLLCGRTVETPFLIHHIHRRPDISGNSVFVTLFHPSAPECIATAYRLGAVWTLEALARAPGDHLSPLLATARSSQMEWKLPRHSDLDVWYTWCYGSLCRIMILNCSYSICTVLLI